MKNNSIVAIVGGALLFVVGFVIGLMAAGPDLQDIDAAVAERLEAAKAADAERLAQLEARVDQLSTDVTGRLDALGTSLESRTSAVDEMTARFGGNLEDLGQSLSGAIDDATANTRAALESGLAGLRGRLSSAAPGSEGDGSKGDRSEGDASEGGDATASGAAAPAEGHSPGETAVLSDGALRVFVSRIDAESGTARLQANGKDFTLAVGESESFAGETGDCRITLDALDRGQAAVSGACGDALPEPQGAAPGTTVDLAEGLRVFISGVTDSGARIAINGVDTSTIPVGKSVEVKVGEQTCQVSVEAVDRGHVALGYACG